MGYIYCITNIINGKKYIGKTTTSVTKRFKEHRRDSRKETCKNRPLYRAMNKYGVDNFYIEQIEACEVEELTAYEMFYIRLYKTTNNKYGYNATAGGDGKILFDYSKIIDLYSSGLTMPAVAGKVGCSLDTVRRIINNSNVEKHHNHPFDEAEKVRVSQYSLDGEFIKTWDCINDAVRWLVENKYAKSLNGGVRQKITMCAKGKLKTAYKFIWKY